METFEYVIIGGGMAAASAIKGIRSVDRANAIALISAEATTPYNRPALSKALWHGATIPSIMEKNPSEQVRPLLQTTVQAIDPAGRIVSTSQGPIGYRKLLIATGAEPRRLPGGDGSTIYFQSLADYQAMRRRVDLGLGTTHIVGSGLLAAELAVGVRAQGADVTLHCRGSYPCDGLLPQQLGQHLLAHLRARGVEVQTNRTAARIDPAGSSSTIHFENGESVRSHCTVACIGVTPRVDVARTGGISVRNGILIDAHMQTSQPDIYAAGDVVEYEVARLGSWMLSNHEENACVGGITAGQVMAGKSLAYAPVPYYYSTIGDINIEAVGSTDARLDTRVSMDGDDGLSYYLDRDGRIVGVLFFNGKPDIEAAKEMIGTISPGLAAVG
ncbi:MAG: FAD-dependent oxidoreductase [Pseudomonadota bacterium]